jgi:hypothetical protein
MWVPARCPYELMPGKDAVAHAHLSPPLSFVPGLGPRKAQALIEHMRVHQVGSRRGLKAFLGEKVFENAAGCVGGPGEQA